LFLRRTTIKRRPAGPFACVDPDGHPRSTVFHCYTTSDIYAAYGVGALHAEGTTGTDQPIVIVDAYGSPTVQQDLDRFSDTLVCRAHKSHVGYLNPLLYSLPSSDFNESFRRLSAPVR